MFEEEFIPLIVYLRDQQTLVSAQVSLAIKYLQVGKNSDRANQLLCSSLQAAQIMRLPIAKQIEAILQHFGMACGE
ncbi:MAG: hypothetical protein HZT40_23070 [Candidatus Thiothrix singaporensis]|uniref:Uncharacterized protein n=1 Tax=Candidatus Thiothrix singaporensis TaxID=2799669 RepID=A0A7L6AYC5_9GAMM|nr:MAG: hypothetical protein HZT40_23070 [Candidatus Thiothrix singaporensis]